MLNFAVLVSGGGTNLQAVIEAVRDGRIREGRICAVISSRAGAFALERAKKHGIPAFVIERKSYPDQAAFDRALLSRLRESEAGLVVLAGFLHILGPEVIRAFPDKIINVHPSLVPAFCGNGFYGLRVHEKALEYGVKVTGATVHFVSEVTDGGAVLLQKAVEVRDTDTPEELQQRVMREAEWELLPRAIDLICRGKVRIDGRKTTIVKE